MSWLLKLLSDKAEAETGEWLLSGLAEIRNGDRRKRGGEPGSEDVRDTERTGADKADAGQAVE